LKELQPLQRRYEEAEEKEQIYKDKNQKLKANFIRMAERYWKFQEKIEKVKWGLEKIE